MASVGHDLLGLGQEVGMLLERGLHEVRGLPKVRCQITVGVPQRLEGGLDEITFRPGVPTRAGKAVRHAAELKHLLEDRRTDDEGTTGRRHKAHAHRAALASDLHGHGVRLAELATPVAPANRDEAQLGCDDASTDGGRHLFCAFGAQADVAVAVAYKNVAYKSVPLPCGGHL